MLATPLNLVILRALASRPMRLAELRQAAGLPAQTTLRGHLASLAEIGVLSKRPTQQMPYAVENELTPMGREMLDVAAELEAWLATAPDGPISLEGGAAKGVIKAFVDGWGSTMMRGLVAQPMSLTELDRLIVDLSYPALERRLASMRMAGLIEARPSRGAGTPYAVTDWARRGVGPLAAAGRCERVHMRKRAAPVTQTDIEAAFMLAVPLVWLSPDVAGACRLEVEAPASALRQPAGVTVRVEGGKVVSCESQLAASPGAFAAGSTSMWFSAVKEGAPALLRFGGSRQLPEDLVTGLHKALTVR
ncbi:MAG TPA: winged helix-turn-helix transcriptional regulator [Solirubrobacterales bacterium]